MKVIDFAGLVFCLVALGFSIYDQYDIETISGWFTASVCCLRITLYNTNPKTSSSRKFHYK